jgi:ribosomal protein S18 acetylase RimI-like enzyme
MAVSNRQIEKLLHDVFVGEGFTAEKRAQATFSAHAVRARGSLIVEVADDELLGMVVLVLPDSPACRMAESDESEMHLLAVAPEHRGAGLGSRLVRRVMEAARGAGADAMLLWTQESMEDAQRLYERMGFYRVPKCDFARGDRKFRVYRAKL